MSNISKKIFKILAAIVASLIAVTLIIYFFIQTETFNRWALEFTLDKINQNSQTRGIFVNADSIRGNILKELILNSGSITSEKDTVLSFTSIELKYDLWDILKHEINIENLKINSPVINFKKIKDNNDTTVWNFSKLFASSKETDAAQTDFDWKSALENAKIENGKINVEGQLSADTPEWRLQNQKMKELDISNIQIRNLELEFSGSYLPENRSLMVRNLSFNTNSDFNVNKFAMNYDMNLIDTISEIDNLELITDKSEIKIEKGMLSGFNPFDDATFENLGGKNLQAEINVRKFNFSELKFFLPAVDMLDSTVGLVLSANGKFGDIKLNRLSLSLPNSEINITGNIKNLDDPENLYIDAGVNDTKIFPEDVKTIYKNNPMPDFSDIGPVYPELNYTGTYKNFYSKFDIKTSAGSFNGNVNVDLSQEIYRGRIVTSNLNPGKIFKDNSLKGNINLAADFSGIGFNQKNIKTNASYTIESSNFAGIDIRNSSGNITLNGSNVSLNTSSISSIGSLNVKGTVNISNIKNPVYKLSGNVSRFNVAAITKSAGDRSSLNFSFDVNGRGISPDNLNGSYNFSVMQSQYASYQTPAVPLNFFVKISGQEKSINLTSEIADFNAEGKFKIAEVIKVLRQNAASVSENISGKFMKSYESGISNLPVSPGENFNLKYSFIVKDSAEVNRMLARYNITFTGDASGQIENGLNGFMSHSHINSSSFSYKDTVVVLNNFSSEIHLMNSPDNLKINLQTSADNILIDSLAFDSAGVFFNLDNSHATVNASVKKNPELSGNFTSVLNFYNDSIVAVADSVLLIYNQYKVQNTSDWILKYDSEAIDIRKMELESRRAVMNVSGEYSFNSGSDITLEGNNIKISDFRDALIFSDSSNRNYADGILKEFLINYKGTAEDPELTLRAASSEITQNLGMIDIKADYKDNNAVMDINLFNPGDSGKLTIKGNIPFQNPFAENLNPEIENTPVSLILDADDFQYKYFFKLIPEFPEMKGSLNGEIKVSGEASSPDMKGTLKITEGSFLSVLTGMNYSFDLNAGTENSKLLLNTLKFYNKDDKAKHIDLFGTVDFAGMKLNDIDLQARGDMVLLNNKVERNKLGLHGYVLGGIGKPPVTIKGNLEKIKIQGELIVREAKISSLPTGGSGYELTGDNFTYVFTEADTNFVLQDTLILVPEKDYYRINPFEKSKYTKDTSTSKLPEFLDIDVNVKTVKNISASIDLKKLPRSKLYGDISADLNFKTVNNILEAKGNVDIVGNSYFKFYRTFKLNDSKIKFTGPVDDPELNIQAVYEGAKVAEQYGNLGSSEVEVKLTITGRASKPEVKASLIENGSEVTGSNAQADAMSYLLFGRYKSDLTTPERTTMSSTFGSAYLSYFVAETLQEIFPFILDAEFNYVQGSNPHTEVELMSEFGEATVTVGANIFRESTNLEFSIDYPLNKLLKADLPEKLMLELFQEQLGDEIVNESQTAMTTGLKVIYKIKF